MGCLFPKTNPAGERLPRWYVTWTDAAGRRRQRAAYRDRRASERLLSELEAEAARGEMKLADPHAKAKATPLGEHLAHFGEHLEAKGVTAKHRTLTLSRLAKAFDGMGAAKPGDMTTQRAERFLAGLTATGTAAKTRNDYQAALSQFADWGVRERRWAENPFKCIGRLNAAADVRRERRALTAAEVGRLCEAAKTRAHQETVANYPGRGLAQHLKAKRLAEGQERSVIYLTAALSGLRLGELTTLSWGDLDLDAGRVTVQACHAKSRREDRVELPPELVDALCEWREEAADMGRAVGLGDLVFCITSKLGRHHFAKDAAAAGIELVDGAGRQVDFHGLRHTYATLLSQAGVAPRVAQALMRHADLSTTMRTYTHVELVDRRRAVEALPKVKAGEPKEERLRLAAGAESLRPRTQAQTPTLSAPRGANAVKAVQERRESATAQNLRFAAVNAASDKNGQEELLGDKKWRRRESNPRPVAFQHELLRA